MKMKEKLIEIKRNLIIEDARRLFFKKGYENTTIDDVARAVGISKSTLYAYFLSKEEILLRVFIQEVDDSFQKYQEAVFKKSTGYDQLYAYSITAYNCYENKPQYLHIFDSILRILSKNSKISSRTNEIFKASHKRSDRLLTEIFELGLKDKTLRVDLEIELAKSYFVITIQHIAKLFILSPKFAKEDFLTAVEYFLKGFKK
jgi:AcrR family transcriptional regulator